MREILVRANVNLPDFPYGETRLVDLDDVSVLLHVQAGHLQPVQPVPMTDDQKPPRARQAKGGSDTDETPDGPTPTPQRAK